MIASMQAILAPYYAYIKFAHLFFVMIWMWSTAVGFAYYLVPVFKAWRRNPGDAKLVELRNWAIERFDHGVTYEHVAFPMIVLTGPLLWIAGGWSPASGWLVLKLLIVVGIFLPVEIFDYYVSHLGGNKQKLRKRGDALSYEKGVHWHWMFLLVSSPPIMILGTAVVLLAVVKPF